MRLTELRWAHHTGRQFKYMWLTQARRKVPSIGAEKILASKGIEVCDPKEILSPPFIRKNVHTIEPLPEVEQINLPPCYIFRNNFSAPAGVSQIQNLTNTIVRNALPNSVLDDVTENTEEENDRVKEAILHAHLFDSHQEKLPRMIDVINRPGWSYPLDYGMPVRRKNKNLSYQLILLLDQLFPEAASRHLVEKTKLQVMLKHSGNLMQMKHEAAFVLSSLNPLTSPLANGEAALNNEEESIPDIYPLSPFLHCKNSTSYSEEEFYGVPSSKLHPHTVFIHLNMPSMRHTDDTFSADTIMKAFSHAAAYAKLCCKMEQGDLEKPIVLQIVHTNGNKFHLGVFQLNTLDLNGNTKNIFWSHPVEKLFEKCVFKAAGPNLEGYNPSIFSLLKAFHLQ